MFYKEYITEMYLKRFYYIIISGSQESSCSSGIYYLTAVPGTNTYFLVIDDWTNEVMETRGEITIGLNCLIERT